MQSFHLFFRLNLDDYRVYDIRIRTFGAYLIFYAPNEAIIAHNKVFNPFIEYWLSLGMLESTGICRKIIEMRPLKS